MHWWLAQNTLIAAVLALAVSLASRWGRFSPSVRHALWLVVLFKLIAPPMTCYSLPSAFRWPHLRGDVQEMLDSVVPEPSADVAFADTEALPRELRAGPTLADEGTGDLPRQSIADSYASPDGDEVNDDDLLYGVGQTAARDLETPAIPPVAGPVLPGATAGDASGVMPLTQGASAADRFGRLAFWGWLLGTAGMTGVQSTRLLRFRRLLAASKPAPSWLAALVERSAALIGVAAPRTRVTSQRCSPLVCVMGRPNLLWPASLTTRLAGESRRAVIVHELAHMRRRDHWVGWLELAASCLWWWNPLFWFVHGQLRASAELACDAWVVSLLPQGRRHYAQALIEVTQFVSWTAAPVPAVGLGGSARRSFERRLTMILQERFSCRAPWFALASILVFGLAVLPGWTQTPLSDDVADEKPAATPRLPEKGPVVTIENALKEERVADTNVPLAAPEQPRPIEDRPVEGTADVHKTAAPQLDPHQAHLEQLEARLAQLLDEVRALRGERRTVVWGQADDLPAPHSTRVGRPQAPLAMAATKAAANKPRSVKGVELQNLTRARYHLAPEAAKALAAFIEQHVKADIDVKADAATMVVTASSEDQARIGAFVELLSPPGEKEGAKRNDPNGANKLKSSLRRTSPSDPSLEKPTTSGLNNESAPEEASLPKRR
jgi:beta-lactamase regulating signal transducer with metallopeptidase domain